MHRGRRLGRARDAEQHDVGLVQVVGAAAVVVLDGELDRGDAAEVLGVERRAAAGDERRLAARGGGDRVQGRAEHVVHDQAARVGDLDHRLAQRRVDERVEHRRAPARGRLERPRELLAGLHAGVADHLDLGVLELALRGPADPRGGVPRGVGHDVDLEPVGHVRGSYPGTCGGRPPGLGHWSDGTLNGRSRSCARRSSTATAPYAYAAVPPPARAWSSPPAPARSTSPARRWLPATWPRRRSR